MTHPERWLAALVAVACLLVLARLLLGRSRRQRLDAALKRAQQQARARLQGVSGHRQARRHAEQVAAQAIEKARRRGFDKEGNVIKPRAFQKQDKRH